MNKIDYDAIERFRLDLPIIRSFAGWSLETLADVLGISKTTMIRIEKEPGAMNTVYYLAIMKLIDEEKLVNPVLGVVMLALNDESGLITRERLINNTREVICRNGRKRGMTHLKQELHNAFRKWVI